MAWSYEVPFVVLDDMDPAQARKMLNAVYADPENPYFDANHVQHRDYVDFTTKLHTIIATAEAEEKDAAAAQALSDARDEIGDLAPAECLARGRALLASPGYVTGTMEPKARAKLKKQIDALYLVGSQTEEKTPARSAPEAASDDGPADTPADELLEDDADEPDNLEE